MKSVIKKILKEELGLDWIEETNPYRWKPHEAAKFLHIKPNSAYRRAMDRYLKSLYGDQWEKFEDGKIGVVINGKWSILNYANTNHKLAAFLLTMLGVEPNDGSPQFFTKMRREYPKFLHPNGEYYHKVIEVLSGTAKSGDKRENIAVKILKSRLKEPASFEVGGLGNVTDMKTGVDIRMKTKSGREFTFQVKPYSNIRETEDGKIVVEGVRGASLYSENTVNFLFFVKDLKNYAIFHNKGFELIDRQTMVTDEDNLYAKN